MDLVQFVLKNRKDSNAFKDWSELEIARLIKKSIDSKSICFSTDILQHINGICIGIVSHEIKEVYIIGIILTEPRLIRDYIEYFRKYFPGYNLKGLRKNSKVLDFTKKLTLLERL